jgi:hypothetical protein
VSHRPIDRAHSSSVDVPEISSIDGSRLSQHPVNGGVDGRGVCLGTLDGLGAAGRRDLGRSLGARMEREKDTRSPAGKVFQNGPSKIGKNVKKSFDNSPGVPRIEANRL